MFGLCISVWYFECIISTNGILTTKIRLNNEFCSQVDFKLNWLCSIGNDSEIWFHYNTWFLVDSCSWFWQGPGMKRTCLQCHGPSSTIGAIIDICSQFDVHEHQNLLYWYEKGRGTVVVLLTFLMYFPDYGFGKTNISNWFWWKIK